MTAPVTDIENEPKEHTVITGNHGTASLWIRAILFAILLVALGLRLYGIQASYWLDEIITHERANQPLFKVLTNSAYPLGNLLAHFSLSLGDTEFLLRLPNLAAGMISIYLIYLIARETFGSWTALLACAMLTVSAYHIEYSQDARYYSIMVMFGLLALRSLYQYIISGVFRHAFLFGTAAALGLLNQPTFILYLGGLLAPASILLISNQTIPWRKRIHRLLLLIFVAALSAAPLALAYNYHFQLKAEPTIITPLHAREGKEHTALSVSHYVDFLSSHWSGFFAHYTVASKICIFGIALLGIAVAFIRNKAAAVLMIGAFILSPIPAFLFKTSSPYYSRYFIYQLPLILMFFSCGISGISSVAVMLYRKILKREAVALDNYDRTVIQRLIAVIIVVLILLPVLPGVAKSLKAYYSESIAPEDWKKLARRIAMEMAPQDMIVHAVPGKEDTWKYLSKYPLDFYLDQYNVVGRPPITPQNNVGLSDRNTFDSALSELARNAADATIWLIMPQSWKSSLGPVNQHLFMPVAKSPRLQVRVLGTPTTNSIMLGGFNSKEVLDFIKTGRNVSLAGAEGLHGTDALYSARSEPGYADIAIPVTPSFALRNGSFDEWINGKPVGWLVDSEIQNPVNKVRHSSGNTRLDINSRTSQPIVLRQKIHLPYSNGTTVSLRSWSFSDNPGALRMRFSYDLDGQKQHQETSHPGNGEWETVTLETFIPARATSNLDLEIIHQSTRRSVAHVELIEVMPQKVFDSDSAYTLSVWVKYKNIQQHKWPASTGRLALSGTEISGKPFWRDLQWWEGSSDWTKFAFTIDPTSDKQLANLAKLSIYVGIAGGTGTLWVDNVQLEAGPSTPFTDGARPPHDEAIARIQSQLTLETSNSASNR